MRLVLGGVLFAVTIAAFVFPDLWGSGTILTLIGSVQFVPSALKQLSTPRAVAVGFVGVVLLTLLAGRVYCSTLCPLGILQDVVIWARKKVQRRVRYRYRVPAAWLQYSVLAGATLLALCGSMTLLNLLEPFSNFGRMMASLVAPAIGVVNNTAAFLLARSGVYVLVHIPLINVEVAAVVGSAAFLAVVVLLSYRSGRLFCNTLCPTGALLSLLARVSLLRIRIDESGCEGCGICERACRAECIDTETKRVDWSVCVGCYDCLAVCPADGFVIASLIASRREGRAATISGRRQVVGALIGSVLLGGHDSTSVLAAAPGVPTFDESRRRAISPPGSGGRRRFTQLCTACHVCVSACPTKVLSPALTEYGLDGVFQPRLNYAASYCNFDCVECGEVCPTGAIRPMPLKAKQSVQIGKAAFVKSDCIVETKKTDCGACSEHCPTKAVRMVPYGRLLLPEVHNDYCVGCGACEHACPTKPRKAIYVVANDLHQRAMPPPREQLEKAFDSTQEFPF